MRTTFQNYGSRATFFLWGDAKKNDFLKSVSTDRTVAFCFIYWYHGTFFRNLVPYFNGFYIDQLMPCLVTRVIVTRVLGRIMHILTLLACSIFGDPAVPDPPSAENRVSRHPSFSYAAVHFELSHNIWIPTYTSFESGILRFGIGVLNEFLRFGFRIHIP